MRKKQIREGPGALQQTAPTLHGESNDGKSSNRREKVASHKHGVELPRIDAPQRQRPHSHRELADAILAAADPVRAGCELLEPDEGRADPTRLSALRTFADWAYGRPDAEGHGKPPRIIWDIPGPPYEPVDPELEKLEGGDE